MAQINHAGEGGLYAEMVADRSFDGIAHAMGFDPAAPITQPGEAALAWRGAELQEFPQVVLTGDSAPETEKKNRSAHLRRPEALHHEWARLPCLYKCSF